MCQHTIVTLSEGGQQLVTLPLDFCHKLAVVLLVVLKLLSLNIQTVVPLADTCVGAPPFGSGCPTAPCP
jgi:hypothetical protein